MTLISLIVALLAERVAIQSKYWQESFYSGMYLDLLQAKNLFTKSLSDAAYLGVVILPAVILLVVVNNIDSSLIRLVLDTVILLVCLGCPGLRENYKCYLQAANRGDFLACSMYADQIGHSDHSPGSFGQMLVWLNYQHYAAVIIWFAILGPAGAVLYVLARSSAARYETSYETKLPIADRLMTILDWVPVRITALGLLLMGHFSRALPKWLTYLSDVTAPAKDVLRDVACAAEEIEVNEDDYTEEPCTLVRLAKRNVMFLVVVISVLSLSGWIR